MNSTYDDRHSSPGITDMSEALVEDDSNQALRITSAEIDPGNEEKHLLSNQDNPLSNEQTPSVPLETSKHALAQKQKSLVSVYDNSNDSEQQLLQQQQQQANLTSKNSSLPLVGIIGRNRRAEAFRKRLILSNFPEPIRCDINQIDLNPNEKSIFVSHETFFQSSPSIILITENLSTHCEHLFRPDKEYLIIDAREIVAPLSALPLAGIQRAFGNLSDWEIENGTERVPVAVEQRVSKDLIEFIHRLQCFSPRILYLDSYSYVNEQRKAFRHCLFPLVSTILIFSLCFVLSVIEHHYRSEWIYRQASSITGATSLTLLAILLMIRPKLEFIDYMSSLISKNQTIHQFLLPRFKFIRRWLQSRHYLAWYSLSFALLHLVFLLLSKLDVNAHGSILGGFFGIFTLILLIIVSFTYVPSISERLLWREYHVLTSYLAPFCLLIGFLHVFLHWRNESSDHERRTWFSLKFLSMLLPIAVLILRLILYGFIRPTVKLFQWIRKRRSENASSSSKSANDPSLLIA